MPDLPQAALLAQDWTQTHNFIDISIERAGMSD
jgi:hypothetical protein